MKLTVVAQSAVSQWKVVAVVEERHGESYCPFQDQLNEFGEEPKHATWVVGLEVVWARINRYGPRALGDSLYHQVDEEEGIFEFRKGRLRVLCFEVDGAVCVCSTVFMKRTKKVPKDEVKRAIALKERYLQEMRSGSVSYENC